MNEEKYREMVQNFLRNDSTEIFGNFTPAHAGFITKEFIQSAQSSIELLSGCFPNNFYKEATEALETAAKRLTQNGGRIRVITADGIVSEELRKMEKDNPTTFSYLDGTYIGNNPINHFLVVDGKRYRLEEPHEKSSATPAVVQAEVCCNGRKKAQELRDYFDSVWNTLEKLKGLEKPKDNKG